MDSNRRSRRERDGRRERPRGRPSSSRETLNDPIQLIGPASLVGNSRETFHKSGTDGSNPALSSGESDELGDLCQPQRMSRLSAPTRRSKIPRPPGNRKVEPGATVAVIGCGGVGLSAVNGAALAGAERIIAIDTVPSKLEVARELGATDTLNASNADPVKAVRDM